MIDGVSILVENVAPEGIQIKGGGIVHMRSIRLDYLVPGTLLVYVTLHLLEEWLFGFPAWAEQRWGIPDYTVLKWLMHNAYFTFFLVSGYIIYRVNKEKFLPLGLGIIIWGLLNFANHVVFSLIFLEYSPGLITSFIFLLLGILALRQAKIAGQLSTRVTLLSVLCALLYWDLPMGLFITVDLMLGL